MTNNAVPKKKQVVLAVIVAVLVLSFIPTGINIYEATKRSFFEDFESQWIAVIAGMSMVVGTFSGLIGFTLGLVFVENDRTGKRLMYGAIALCAAIGYSANLDVISPNMLKEWAWVVIPPSVSLLTLLPLKQYVDDYIADYGHRHNVE